VDASTDGEYTCRECGSNAVRVLDAGRRDIGKGETWGSNNHDHAGRFLTCVKCNHRWEES
jgi:DNA-directed RNA polymerase subunit M/transcription elongation factor TFIIS